MPPKAKIAAPIDRPLSRAYLREFTGWSTAYPPGLSDPTSLRIMENLQINRDGSVRVRPGLKHLSYESLPSDAGAGTGLGRTLVGTHEPFYLADGAKAYLFAVREDDATVGFRVLVLNSAGPLIRSLTDAGVSFSVPQGLSAVNFTSATTYVKYLQIDNKIFALSNAGEPMRMFYVGQEKRAIRLNSIEQPGWNIGDKLEVVHPEASWIQGGTASYRINHIVNPSFETGSHGWGVVDPLVQVGQVPIAGYRGTGALQIRTLPTAYNLMPSPLHDPVNHGFPGWQVGTGMQTLEVDPQTNRLRAISASGIVGRCYVNGPRMTQGISEGFTYRIGFEVLGSDLMRQQGVLIRFYNSVGSQIGDDRHRDMNGPGWVSITTTAPAGATQMQIFPYVEMKAGGSIGVVLIGRVLVNSTNEPGGYFSGASGPGFQWTGTPHNSLSVAHVARAAEAYSARISVVAGYQYTASAYFKTSGASRPARVAIQWVDGNGAWLRRDTGDAVDDGGGWSARAHVTGYAPTGASGAVVVAGYIDEGLEFNELHQIDAVLFEAGTLKDYYDGDSPEEPTFRYRWWGTKHNSWSVAEEYTEPLTIPAAEARTVNTLISSDGTKNTYSVGFFYTFHNEIGESAASQVTVVRMQRPWSAWRWETANAEGEPSGTSTPNPQRAADQLVAYMPQTVFDSAMAAGAIGWNLYMLTWSDQATVPVSALKIASRDLKPGDTHAAAGRLRMTPAQADAGVDESPLPSEATRYNYSDPSCAGQGVVAGDRMILVYDPKAAAVVRWSANRQGDYSNFTANRGGGYKTLTSGNLYVPAAVKLWQNPESKDTITILCQGVDGHSVSYYMAPSSVSSQSDNVLIMGFEETTATPGTVSPYGVEVFNNALYHPLETELMKSTASNYNISHKSQTDAISNMWIRLQQKERIVSSQLDRRLYYLVYNPNGEELEAGCWANELWVLDGAEDAGSWSRWLVQGSALRKIEVSGRTHMSLVRPDGLFYFDDQAVVDEYIDHDNGRKVATRDIEWRLETNTQGANRAHDAWAHLRQASVTFGNFRGKVQWGVRGLDLHGKRIDKHKITQDHDAGTFAAPFDIDDHLQIARDMKEWVFYASSVEGEHSEGQISLVQYRYAPISVNVGYEYGQIESFEYQRNVVAGNNALYTDGTTTPMLDRSRP